MASSRKPKRSSPLAPLRAAVRARLESSVSPGQRVLVGLSGGVDSVVLLDVLAHLAPRMRFELAALHVNHQLSVNAKGWARFCRSLCRDRDIPLKVARVKLAQGNSLERAAREARFAAFTRVRAHHVALAHNQNDQAETVLLRLLRGAGVKGLGAMPFQSADARGSILRPLLATSRAEIEAYARARKLEWIEDESNADPAFTRNWLRGVILPQVAERVPTWSEALARTAAHASEASGLLDELAQLDARSADESGSLSTESLRAIGVARAKNVVRFLIAARGWRMPDADALEEGLRQALSAKPDAAPIVNLGECELRRHGSRIYVVPKKALAGHAEAIVWNGERRLALPSLGGVLTMSPRVGRGLSRERLSAAPVTVRVRAGGERLQLDPSRPRRTVKNLLQEARLSPWARERLPFIYSGDTLACIPGVGIEWRFLAQHDEPSVEPVWRHSS